MFLSFAQGCSSAQPARRAITEFGAVADGTTFNTKAIQSGIDQIAAAGGGTIVIPEGTFLSGALFFKPGVHLHLDKGAVLKGSTNVADYPKRNTRIEGHFEPWLPALTNFDKCDGLRISGEGTLDGSGEPFWLAFRNAIKADRATKNLDIPRPRLMLIENARDVQITGLRFKDSGFWNLHLYRCQDVVIDGLDIRAPKGSPSSDAIDIDSSQRVTVKNCYISTNDDCICLKGSKGPFALDDKDSPPVEHIRVSNCTFADGHGVLTCGSEATIIRDVIVEDCIVEGSSALAFVRLKLRPDTPQHYENIHYRNITMNGAGRLFSIEPWRQYFDLKGQEPPKRTVKNVTVTNVKGTYGSFGTIRPNEGDVVEGLVLENIDVNLTSDAPPRIGGVDITVKNVKINGKEFVPEKQ